MLANKSSNKLHEDIKINYAVGLLQYSNCLSIYYLKTKINPKQ
jgi:hypothetical protein